MRRRRYTVQIDNLVVERASRRVIVLGKSPQVWTRRRDADRIADRTGGIVLRFGSRETPRLYPMWWV